MIWDAAVGCSGCLRCTASITQALSVDQPTALELRLSPLCGCDRSLHGATISRIEHLSDLGRTLMQLCGPLVCRDRTTVRLDCAI
jgi:hypothetical protein